ncbi:sensor domain-containing diguanylate cyclase [Methylobacterium sp. E-045]|uniref:sensor domain-containing diguanylate cyclase n=1 Tax=Methylobacterium sp. E-045 TaxID=2836575 RepID=UPI001FBA5DC1|nr:sensor domain-containing diguanylate cyclase [Methylobacterium sp. E-045]
MVEGAPIGKLSKWNPSSAWLSAFGILSVVGLCVISALMLWQMRWDTARKAEITSRSLVQVLSRDIDRNIDLYNIALRTVIEGIQRPEVMDAAPQLRHMLLFDRITTAPGFGYILVLDQNGNVIANSQTLGPTSINVADREYFQHFAANADDNLHVSAPVISRVSGQWMLTLSRRISNAEGAFQGVVTGGIYLSYFHSLFSSVDVNNPGTVTLSGPGGTIVMREPYEPKQIGTSISQTVSYKDIIKTKSGSFTGPAMLGTGDRLFVFTQIQDLPLYLSVALPLHDIYAGWWWKALALGFVVLALSATIIALIWRLGRELFHRTQAEQITAALNIELKKLATTDALTGLFNRRQFDISLSREWRRAVRNHHQLSLLILDADYFKGFNDRYGHQKGDEALQLIARSIEAAIDRSHDIACRIGGEEFAVVLPDTDAAGAIVVAERIRTSVLGWKVPHAVNPHALLTISGGLAHILETSVVDPTTLMAAADQALYKAKAGGRNQVRASANNSSPSMG